MKQYQNSKIKNVALVGHSNSGKTTLAEAILYLTKSTDRFGKIAEGNTTCDYDAEEIRRNASINTALAPVEYKDEKINFLDTPGLFDFTTGFYEGARAAAGMLITISGKSGIAVGTRKSYKYAKRNDKWRMFFVSKLDRDSADFYKVLEELKTKYGPTICPIVVPYYKDKKVESYVDLINMKAYTYKNGAATEVAIPESEHRLEGLVTAISEAVAETDEALFEKYFSGERFTRDELVKGIHDGIKSRTITPVLCGSAENLEAIDLLINAIYEIAPNSKEVALEKGLNSKNEEVQIECDEDAKASAFVFKTIADPFIGKLSFVKVVSGKIKTGNELLNKRTGKIEKIGKLVYLRGKKQEDTDVIPAGDIGIITKLDAQTGDTLCDKDMDVVFKPATFDEPCYSMAILPKSKGDESKISNAISKILEEDKSLSFKLNTETHQQILSGLGEQHLDVVVTKLKEKYGVEVGLEPPIVAYRETILKKVRVQGKHKKQSGGHGQYGDVWIEFEPCDSDDIVFEQKVVGGAVPKGYFPAVEKGIRESALHGTLAGYPVVGLKAILVDGSYHPVDSSEMSFKMAASLAYRTGLPEASPALLEPIGTLEVLVPDNTAGDMMGELNKRRGRVLGMAPDEDNEGMSNIVAEVPMSQMHDFATLVRQMTQGSGQFTYDFTRYEQLPNQFVAEVIEQGKKLFSSSEQ